jgi:hypothetical protein
VASLGRSWKDLEEKKMIRRGWYGESVRHSLAARGMRTNSQYMKKKFLRDVYGKKITGQRTKDTKIFEQYAAALNKSGAPYVGKTLLDAEEAYNGADEKERKELIEMMKADISNMKQADELGVSYYEKKGEKIPVEQQEMLIARLRSIRKNMAITRMKVRDQETGEVVLELDPNMTDDELRDKLSNTYFKKKDAQEVAREQFENKKESDEIMDQITGVLSVFPEIMRARREIETPEQRKLSDKMSEEKEYRKYELMSPENYDDPDYEEKIKKSFARQKALNKVYAESWTEDQERRDKEAMNKILEKARQAKVIK